jgi:hypothetical protein
MRFDSKVSQVQNIISSESCVALQVHQSQVSFLAVSEDGETLFSGCDAAAPKLVEGPDVPAAAVSSKVQCYTSSGRHYGIGHGKREHD